MGRILRFPEPRFWPTSRLPTSRELIGLVNKSRLAVTNPVTQNRGIILDWPDAYLYY